MRWFLGLGMVYAIISFALIALGTATGALLHWIFPGVDFGTCILIGVVAGAVSFQVMYRIASTAFPVRIPGADEYEDDDDEDEDDEPEDDGERPTGTYPPPPQLSRPVKRRRPRL